MASINFATREINCKIVYYGPGVSGKTTNLQVIHQKLPQDKRTDMVSLATEQDRTLFFDFLPLDLGAIRGFKTRFQLYTVPGQVYYNSTRKLVLRGVDGVVFVADSQKSRHAENIESLQNLIENLREYGFDLKEIPFILQYNKRDLPDIFSVDELNQRLNFLGVETFEASAHVGTGVIATLKAIARKVIEKFNQRQASAPGARPLTAAQPEPPPASGAPASPAAAAAPSPPVAPQRPASAPQAASKAPTAASRSSLESSRIKSILDDYDDFDMPKISADDENIELRPYIPKRKQSESTDGGESK